MSRDRVCTAATPDSRLSTYIATSSGWSKPVWNLLATNITLYSSVANASRRSRPFKPGFIEVSVTFSSPDSVVGDLTGERHQGGDIGVALFGDVLVERQLVAHRRLARRRDDHRLGLAVQPPADVLAEVLDDDLHLLGRCWWGAA